MTSVLFILPASGGSGGAHSVMQEADAMRALGVDAVIASNQDNAPKLRRAYRDLSTIQNFVLGYQGAEGLGELIKRHSPQVVVATTNQSVHVLDAALKHGQIKNQRTAYYVQDYEPLFYQKGSSDWMTAFTSYNLIPEMVRFAKTRWLQEVVEENHLVRVEKVQASIDHKVYYPNLQGREPGGKLRIAAMLRPATARRAPRRTTRIINRIAAEFPHQVDCTTFGCTVDELKAHSLPINYAKHLGVLSRQDIGDLFRNTDLFLDLSDFQAFGRTAIEAMSCGTIAAVPAHGGAYEYAVDGLNAFVVDTRSDDSILSAARQFVAMSAEERQAMSLRGIQAGYRYSPESAALSEIAVLLN